MTGPTTTRVRWGAYDRKPYGNPLHPGHGWLECGFVGRGGFRQVGCAVVREFDPEPGRYVGGLLRGPVGASGAGGLSGGRVRGARMRVRRKPSGRGMVPRGGVPSVWERDPGHCLLPAGSAARPRRGWWRDEFGGEHAASPSSAGIVSRGGAGPAPDAGFGDPGADRDRWGGYGGTEPGAERARGGSDGGRAAASADGVEAEDEDAGGDEGGRRAGPFSRRRRSTVSVGRRMG